MLPNPMDLFLALSSVSTSFFLSLFLFLSAFIRHVYQHQSTFSYSSVFFFWIHSCKLQTTISLHTQWLHQEQNLLLCTKSSSNLGSIDILTQGLRSLTHKWIPLRQSIFIDTPADSTVPKLILVSTSSLNFSYLPNQARGAHCIIFISCIQDFQPRQTNALLCAVVNKERCWRLGPVATTLHCRQLGLRLWIVLSDQFPGHKSSYSHDRAVLKVLQPGLSTPGSPQAPSGDRYTSNRYLHTWCEGKPGPKNRFKPSAPHPQSC